jgi:TfoX/Sxy family transcriptional regulator of competence genes
MPHDPLFEQRIATAIKAHGANAEAKKMFGGVAFMVNGNMSVGITNKADMMVRFDAARHEEVLEWPGAKPMTYGHGNMRGFVFVDAETVATKAALDKWVNLSLEHVLAMPKKKTIAKSTARSADKVSKREK